MNDNYIVVVLVFQRQPKQIISENYFNLHLQQFNILSMHKFSFYKIVSKVGFRLSPKILVQIHLNVHSKYCIVDVRTIPSITRNLTEHHFLLNFKSCRLSTKVDRLCVTSNKRRKVIGIEPRPSSQIAGLIEEIKLMHLPVALTLQLTCE